MLNHPAGLDEIEDFIAHTLNATYGKQPSHIVFVCGDAHAPGGGPGPGLDLCNTIAGWILDGRFAPYCSLGLCRDKIALHLECGSHPDEIQQTLRDADILNMREIGLDQNISGWEPIGFANFSLINDLMSQDRMSKEQITQACVLINQSNVYFRSLEEDWTQIVILRLLALADTVQSDLATRIRALTTYGNALLDVRVVANMALADGINQSILNTDRKVFAHFASVGNAHIVEGITIIDGIELEGLGEVIGFSIGRVTG